MEVVPRNLISQLDNNKLNPHRVSSFCFNTDWSTMTVCLEEESKNSLKFYRRRYGADYELVSKIENAHR